VVQKIIIHFDEINLKKKNRAFFEKKLIQNLKQLTPVRNIKKEYGYLIGEISEDPDPYLSYFPGIYSYALAKKVALDMGAMSKAALDLALKIPHQTFAIDTRRHVKQFPMQSPDINREIGAIVQKKTGAPVNIKNPDLRITVEITQDNGYVHGKKNLGIGGLPVGSAGEALCLLSGGIDSPVAAYMLMKRGSKIQYIHFLNATDVTIAVKDKIEDLVKQLAKIQGKSRLFIVPFQDLQWEIISKVHEKYRMLVYRRFMLKIANRVAQKEKIKALITGDSLSQVASQTIENIQTVYESSELPILHPLIGFNKLETIRIAEKIGTMEISSRPYDDCCTFYVPKHPATKANVDIILKQEKDLDDEVLIESVLAKMQVKIISLDK